MNLSMKWLSDYVTCDMPPREFSEGMTISGSKVEGYEIEGEDIKNVVVGQVVEMEKHPDSDHLWICQIDVGQAEKLQIITGAQNLSVNDFVPVALHNSLLPGGVKITKGKLRGLVSNGMLCSLGELMLTLNDFPYAIEDGIFVLGEDCDRTAGLDIQSAISLNDTKVEFEITSNRPDCLSVRGLAREAGATFDLPVNLPEPKVNGCGGKAEDFISVTVENKTLCQRYMAAVVKNIKIEPSPLWLRQRLRASGVRPINNIVDITNYVMLEYGHPMHGFDLDSVEGGKIVVRNAKAGETIVTLDEVERKLSEEMLVIADSTKPAAIAGVMGGMGSGIEDSTKTIVFEAACFAGGSVRTTAKKVGLRSESSSRFEKGLDSRTCSAALARACQLVEELKAGDVVTGIIDIDNQPKEVSKVNFTPEWANKFLGTDISADQMAKFLLPLDIILKDGYVEVPTYRADLEDKADIAEEVARIFGYGNIPTTALKGVAEGQYTPIQKFENSLNANLLAMGCSEIITYSFISPKFYDKIELAKDSELRNSVTILNPLGEDTSIMRSTAIPSMLDILAKNYNNRNLKARLFELATEYTPTEKDKLPKESKAVMIGCYGKEDFYSIKGVVEGVITAATGKKASFAPQTNNPTFHPGRCAVVSLEGKEIGVVGEIHPSVVENFGLAQRTYVARIEVDSLFENADNDKKYRPLPKFPASTRDLAVMCDATLPVAEIEKIILAKGGALLENVELFDVYQGEQIDSGKKSVAYALTLRAKDRTLTVEECDETMSKIVKELETIGAFIRS